MHNKYCLKLPLNLFIICLIIISLNVSGITINKSQQKFAVIIVGRYAGQWQDVFPDNFQKYYGWYLNAAGMMYSTLRDTYDYSDESIFLLATLRENYETPESFNPEWVDFESNKENLHDVLLSFKPGEKNWLKHQDSLLLCYINHGNDENSKKNGKYAHDTFFGFPYEFSNLHEIIRFFILKQNTNDYRLYDWEFSEFCENIYAGKMIFLLQPCNSGGFINDLSGINRIICTASREDEVATVSWIEPIIRGLRGDAEANDDGRISILEAYEYAARKVLENTMNEHPLLDDNSDGIGHHFSEVGYNPCNPNNDGYLAARSFL
jgi:hypothetical protein